MAETETTFPQTTEPEQGRGILDELVKRNRIVIFGLAFAIELAIYFGATVIPIDPAQQQELANLPNSILGSAPSQGSVSIFAALFSHNLEVALLEMIPAAGAAVFFISTFLTGQVIQAGAISSNLPGPLLGVFLFLVPDTLVEQFAYAVAVASGTMLIVAWRRRQLVRELRVFALEAGVVAFTLVLAAALETVVIVDSLVGFALWLPTALGIFALVMAVRGAWRLRTSPT
ncbi:MAG: stage II sporulation protein M [Nitrososphaerales archaeon]|nr:stage II sporulation protein M [Nitrososphaerales archaeon]